MIKRSRSLIGSICIIFIAGIGYIVCSISSHDPTNPLCACMLCATERMPADGEYLYNHYLFVLSTVWIAFMVILGYIVKERTERSIQKTHKKRNR